MVTKGETVDSLIDWSSPMVEQKHFSKPLIPLPKFTSPVEVAEDNPFDAVERQVNENELLDVLNLNLSFANTSNEDSSDDDEYHEHLIDLCEAVNDVDIKTGECRSSVESDSCEASAVCAKTSRNKASARLDSSPVSSISNTSDIKEMVLSRISLCINQALHETQGSQLSTRTTRRPYSLNSSRTTSPQSKLNYSLNEGFISSASERGEIDFTRSFADAEDDLQSVVPCWDEISSSDEEPEKRVTSLSLVAPKPSSVSAKKMSVSAKVEKSSDIREPLLLQDPNVRVKKANPVLKHGPLKAVMPVSDMKKVDRNIGRPTNEHKPAILRRSKTRTSPQPKDKRWSAPVASSTPQGRASLSMTKTSVRRSVVRPQVDRVRPPSPDSTSSYKYASRASISLRGTSKSCVRKLASSVVSSSTSMQIPSPKVLVKSVRNKENIMPFRY